MTASGVPAIDFGPSNSARANEAASFFDMLNTFSGKHTNTQSTLVCYVTT
jgi:hypothetical protein